jgi:hypothetical protein
MAGAIYIKGVPVTNYKRQVVFSGSYFAEPRLCEFSKMLLLVIILHIWVQISCQF